MMQQDSRARGVSWQSLHRAMAHQNDQLKLVSVSRKTKTIVSWGTLTHHLQILLNESEGQHISFSLHSSFSRHTTPSAHILIFIVSCIVCRVNSFSKLTPVSKNTHPNLLSSSCACPNIQLFRYICFLSSFPFLDWLGLMFGFYVLLSLPYPNLSFILIQFFSLHLHLFLFFLASSLDSLFFLLMVWCAQERKKDINLDLFLYTTTTEGKTKFLNKHCKLRSEDMKYQQTSPPHFTFRKSNLIWLINIPSFSFLFSLLFISDQNCGHLSFKICSWSFHLGLFLARANSTKWYIGSGFCLILFHEQRNYNDQARGKERRTYSDILLQFTQTFKFKKVKISCVITRLSLITLNNPNYPLSSSSFSFLFSFFLFFSLSLSLSVFCLSCLLKSFSNLKAQLTYYSSFRSDLQSCPTVTLFSSLPCYLLSPKIVSILVLVINQPNCFSNHKPPLDNSVEGPGKTSIVPRINHLKQERREKKRDLMMIASCGDLVVLVCFCSEVENLH
ncbi:hypothetical protein VP01_99g1 [Puccinia sorghi]|uniref:Uncharacterized protein n=1 Tax=Puccinia sorghi TaxID=27349 RepID=A0A0L6U5P3_9BASI|nr:hypothetical protein VP01_99g1 [Puccinia sorghi]